jgi:hypothetical protein
MFVAVGTALWLVGGLSQSVIGQGRAPARPQVVFDRWLGSWLWWDGTWYARIALGGYSYRPHRQSSVAFFPVFPMFARALGWPFGSEAIPVLLVVLSCACGFGAALLMWRWACSRLSVAASRATVAVMLLYPYAWFLYGAAYADALFLVLVLGAFLTLEHDRPLAAGVLAVLATATRPTGITLVVGLLAVSAARRDDSEPRRSKDRVRPRPRRPEPHLLIGLGGLAVWCAYLWVRFGNPLAFVETEGAPGWNQAPGLHTWLKVSFFDHLTNVPPFEAVNLVVQAALAIAFVLAVPAVTRRFGWGYGVYTAVAVLVPTLSTGDFMGVGRYLLAAFPVFAVIGAHLADRPVRRVGVLSVSAMALVVGTALFTTAHYMA